MKTGFIRGGKCEVHCKAKCIKGINNEEKGEIKKERERKKLCLRQSRGELERNWGQW